VFLSASELTLRTGSHQLGKGTLSRVQKIVFHPLRPEELGPDLAVLVLEEELVMGPQTGRAGSRYIIIPV
jgi:hypothetical protein